MSVNRVLQQLFDKLNIPYQIVKCSESILPTKNWAQQTVPADQLVHIALLRDEHGVIMALYPTSQQLNLQRLNQIVKRKLRFLDVSEIKKFIHFFTHHAKKMHADMGVQLIVDETTTNKDQIYFEISNGQLLKLDAENIAELAKDTLLGSVFSFPQPQTTPQHNLDSVRQFDLTERLKNIDNLPSMPDMAMQLLQLRKNPNATVEQLADIIVIDPAISAQVIRYANSSFFAQPEPVNSLADAIFRVLGYETVMYLAVGTALSKTFTMPTGGPVGQTRIWQNANYSAALCQKLASYTPWEQRLRPSVAYLCALLHNIGFLVIGQLFRHEHQWLNKVLQAEADAPVTLVEQRLLGTTHAEIGKRLMEHWGMPAEVVAVVEHHHNNDYEGEHMGYVKLVQLSDCLLKTHNMSDADSDEVNTTVVSQLGLTEEIIYTTMDEVFQAKENLDTMTMAMIA